MAVQIKCCKYDGDPRVIDKSPSLIITLEARIPEPFNVTDPELFLDNTTGVEDCNYFVINFRKYFKVSQKKVSNKMIRIKLHEDVISTWLPKVYVTGIIAHASEIVSDNVDQGYLTDVNRIISRVRFTTEHGPIRDNPLYVVQVARPSYAVSSLEVPVPRPPAY